MKRIIHHLRRQPEEVRRQVLHVTIFIIAILLALLWIYSLGTNLMDPNTQNKIKKDLKPFSALKSNMINGYNSITEPNLGVQEE